MIIYRLVAQLNDQSFIIDNPVFLLFPISLSLIFCRPHHYSFLPGSLLCLPRKGVTFTLGSSPSGFILAVTFTLLSLSLLLLSFSVDFVVTFAGSPPFSLINLVAVCSSRWFSLSSCVPPPHPFHLHRTPPDDAPPPLHLPLKKIFPPPPSNSIKPQSPPWPRSRCPHSC